MHVQSECSSNESDILIPSLPCSDSQPVDSPRFLMARRACNSCGFTMKMSYRYHRLLIYDVKRTTKIDGMGPFKHSKGTLTLKVL